MEVAAQRVLQAEHDLYRAMIAPDFAALERILVARSRLCAFDRGRGDASTEYLAG